MKYKKEITFIYSDSAEQQIMIPINKEAQKRGYTTKMTSNPFIKAEIGVYCQHQNFPQFSRFSVIMLHDIIQAHGRWPDIWFLEPWNKYDIGILPGGRWNQNWNKCSQFFYTRPKKGIYKVGWPKADFLAGINIQDYRNKFYEKYKMDKQKKTILYAPAWENDGKQDDFVKSMNKLDVNMLIKQGPFSETLFPDICKNIEDMKKKHSALDHVTILDKSDNIFNAIIASDILVSEESSTLCEAILMGIPAVAVTNWVIPDVQPSRYPYNDYDFVIKTTKEKLSGCVQEIIDNYVFYQTKAQEYSAANYENIGRASKIIMDLIDAHINGEEPQLKSIEPNKKEKISFKKNISFKTICAKREITENYCKRIWIFNKIYNVYRKIARKKQVYLIQDIIN